MGKNKSVKSMAEMCVECAQLVKATLGVEYSMDDFQRDIMVYHSTNHIDAAGDEFRTMYAYSSTIEYLCAMGSDPAVKSMTDEEIMRDASIMIFKGSRKFEDMRDLLEGAVEVFTHMVADEDLSSLQGNKKALLILCGAFRVQGSLKEKEPPAIIRHAVAYLDMCEIVNTLSNLRREIGVAMPSEIDGVTDALEKGRKALIGAAKRLLEIASQDKRFRHDETYIKFGELGNIIDGVLGKTGDFTKENDHWFVQTAGVVLLTGEMDLSEAWRYINVVDSLGNYVGNALASIVTGDDSKDWHDMDRSDLEGAMKGIVQKLREAGVHDIDLGIESGSEKGEEKEGDYIKKDMDALRKEIKRRGGRKAEDQGS